MIKHQQRFQPSQRPSTRPWLTGLIASFDAVSTANGRGKASSEDLRERCEAFLAANSFGPSAGVRSAARH